MKLALLSIAIFFLELFGANGGRGVIGFAIGCLLIVGAGVTIGGLMS